MWRRRRLLLALSVLATPIMVGAGCDAAAADPGDNTIRIVDPEGRLREHAVLIESLARETLAAVADRLSVVGVTITIAPDSEQAIAGWGIGGFTPDARTVNLYIDPEFPGLVGLLASRLPHLVAHELHHAVRHRRPGYGGTLLEAMVSEGMADRFAIELLGAPVPPWSDALTADEADRLLDLARPDFDAVGYGHAKWFFGTTTAVPRWTGYTLGYRMVRAYQGAHPEATAADLVAVPASAFRPR